MLTRRLTRVTNLSKHQAIINPDLIAKICSNGGQSGCSAVGGGKKTGLTLGKFTTIMAEKRVGGMFVIGLKQLLN